MSIDGYFGRKPDGLRISGGLGMEKEEGVVVTGKFSVEEARELAAQVKRVGMRYLSVKDYDPVLSAHCRLGDDDS
jgi:hypothetical protein